MADIMDNMVYKKNVPSGSRFCFTRIEPKCKDLKMHIFDPLTRTIFEVASTFFFIHDIFHLDARAMECMRGCVAKFVFVAVYNLQHLLQIQPK